MKLQSFALPSKSNSSSSKSKPSVNFIGESSSRNQSQDKSEFVSEFDAKQNPNSAPKTVTVIPPKENEWRPHKKMKNIELPALNSGNKPLEFEVVDSDVVTKNDPGASMSFGLNLRRFDDVDSSSSGSGDGNGSSAIDSLMLRQFKNDLETLPEEQGFDEYDDVPVDGFGAALLAGYGWQKGKGIGKNAKGDVKIVEYKRRSAKEGIGFMDTDLPSSKVGGDGKGKEKVKSDLPSLKVVGDDGKGNEKVKSDVFGVGKEVRVVRGSKMGLKGRVVEFLGDGMVVLGFEEGKRNSFRVDEIAELGSVEEENCLRKLKELKIRDSRDGRKYDGKKSVGDERSVERERGSKRSRDHVSEKVKPEREHREEKSSNAKRVLWLRSHIRVRIVSKKPKGGKLYLKKGVVVDVIGPGICDILMDDGRELVHGVDQDILETALPKRGGAVLVLLGKHKGVYGKLVEKDSEKETGVVQDADSLQMLNVRLEEIAEYLGDPSELGY